jgi:hypothetical protein
VTDTLEMLEGAIEKIPAALQARSLGAVLGKVDDRTSDALRHAQRCKALADTASALGGLSDTYVRAAIEGVVTQAEEVGDALASAKDAGDLEIILEDYSNLPSSLSRLDQSVRQLWGQKAKSDYQSLIPVGKLLTRLSGAEKLGAKLVETGQKAEALAARLQPAETLAPEIAELKATREALLAELKAFTADPDVDRFLEAVTDGGASLALVQPSVFKWLEEHQALSAFKVIG